MNITNQYIAGFLDGEAYLGLIRRTRKDCIDGFYYKPNVKVTQKTKNAFILKKLQKKYGGYITTKQQNLKTNQHSIDVWEIANRPMVKKLLDDIKDYSIVKKEIIKLLLEFISLPTIKKQEDKKYNPQKADIYSKLRVLNRRGLAETK